MKRAFVSLLALIAFASPAVAGLEGNYRGDVLITAWTSSDSKSCVVEDARLNLIRSGNSMYLWIEGECEGSPIYVNEFFLVAGDSIVHDGEMCGTIEENAFECRDIQGGDRHWTVSRTGDVLTYHYKGYMDDDDGQVEMRARVLVR